MRNHLGLIAFCLAVGCAGTTPQQSTMPDKESSKSLETFARSMFAHLDQSDFQWLKDTACPDAVMFDADGQGNPTNAWGKAAVDQVLDGYAKTMPPGSMHSEITRIQCEANTGLGFCAIDFDQTMTVEGQTMGPFRARGTVTAMIYKDHWIWTSWHGSLREPAPAAPAPAAAPTAAAPVAAAAP